MSLSCLHLFSVWFRFYNPSTCRTVSTRGCHLVIVSFSQNFIFVKTRKTAGTSIELALSGFCQDQDILTPISLADEYYRSEQGWRIAQNFSADSTLESTYRDIVHRRDQDAHQFFIRGLGRQGAFYNHMPAREIKEKVHSAFWESAVKITTERHPYEKAVSKAFFRLWRQKLAPTEFPRILNNIVSQRLMDDRSIYCINGEIAVDEVIKQEEIAHAFPKLLQKLGLRLEGEIPRAKSQIRLDPRPAHEILSPAQRELIYDTCRETFETFGYEP